MLGTVNVPLADLIHKRTGATYFFFFKEINKKKRKYTTLLKL